MRRRPACGDRGASRDTCYVYSAASIKRAYRAIDGAFALLPARPALRAQGQFHPGDRADCCAELGAGADANSGGEIDVALRAGFIPADIVFTGVGKTRDGDRQGDVDLGVKAINAESAGELERIDSPRGRAARARGSPCG